MAQLTCPACERLLSHITAFGVVLDGCTGGCGGLWFDPGELARFEDLNVEPPYDVLRLQRNAEVVVDRSRTRLCPRCIGQPLHPRIMEQTLGLEVDSCMGCGGVFLDLGELHTLRSDRRSVAEMTSIIEDAEKFASQSEYRWPRGLRAVLKLLFS